MDPLIYTSIILALCFIVILIYNTKLKDKIIKYAFLFLLLIFLILIIALDSKFIYEFLKAVITYIWYPNYLIFVIVILINIIYLTISLLKKEKKIINNIITYLLFSISFACYIIFLRLDIDKDLYSSLYQNSSLILMRIVTISFLIGTLIILFIRMRGKDEK